MAEPTKIPVKSQAKEHPVASAGMLGTLERLRRDFDHIFENWGFAAGRSPFGRSPFDLEVGWPRIATWSVTPAVDLIETETGYKITAELPGLSEKDIDIRVANGTVTIKGEKREDKEEREKDYYMSERCYGSFMRSFQLPKGVDMDKIDANFAKGVLTIMLPKTAEAKKEEKRIEVKAA